MLPTDSKARKSIPLARGCLDYFGAALAAVAELSQIANEKHNPGEPMHWSREKSSDHADCIARHLLERGTIDSEDGILHDVKVAWRALAMCQLAVEKRQKDAPYTATQCLADREAYWRKHDARMAAFVARTRTAGGVPADPGAPPEPDGPGIVPEFLKKNGV